MKTGIGAMTRSRSSGWSLAVATVVLLVVAGLVLAACGGSDTTASTSPAASQAAGSPSVAASPSGIPLPTPTVAGIIAFTRYGENEWTQVDYDICVVNTDGTGLSAVPGIDAAREPAWRPE
jgi:hypothetical protein